MSTGIYYSDVNFLIAQRPQSAKLEPEVQAEFERVYVGLNNIITALNNNCGISTQNPADWEGLSGSPYTILRSNHGRLYVPAVETIKAGAMVNFTNDGSGNLVARNANATNNTRPCCGFCNTTGGVTSGNIAEFIVGAGLCPVSGLTPGQVFWLSTSNGQITAGRPSAGGNIEQYVGFALSNTVLYCNPGGYIQH